MNFKTSFMEFDTDLYPQKVLALRIAGIEKGRGSKHINIIKAIDMPLTGFVKCHINDAVWMVPAHCAVWIPVKFRTVIGFHQMLMCVCYLLSKILSVCQTKALRTLSISPLLRELIIRLAQEEQDYDKDGSVARLVDVLVDELISMPTEHFDFLFPLNIG